MNNNIPRQIKILVLLFLSAVTMQSALAQSNEEIAHEKGMEAVRLMDEGAIEPSIKLLEEAKKLDPKNILYPYEIAFAHQLNKDYKSAIKVITPLIKHKDATPRVYQLLGNCYSMDGQREQAIKTYESGLKRFPQAGNLYLERGNMEMFINEYGKALSYYEAGIEADPEFASNYYWSAVIYCNSTEEVWGMIYGEIFMNMERNSQRTETISKLLYDTYKSQIQFTSDTSYSVSFAQNAVIDASSLKDPGNPKLPFGLSIYEPALLFSILSEKTIGLTSLNNIRSRFVDYYFSQGHNKSYPNVLFSYQKQVKDAGHIEAYNHWILMMGDEPGFAIWRNQNQDKWDRFVAWFKDHQIHIDQSNRFSSKQY